MARKPETAFRLGVEKYLPSVYKEKMANPFRAGGADCWYSGSIGDLWVEYKFLARVPVRVPVEYGLSTLQLRWLNSRHAEGRNVAVVVGCKNGGVILRNQEWNTPMPPVDFLLRVVSRKDVAAYIHNQTGDSPSCASCVLSSI